MTKEERVIHYYDLASMPEYLPYDTSSIMKKLDISPADVENYRQKLESELSMKPTEKRDVVIKQVIKPLLKKCGFSTAGLDWHRETDDSFIIIHMMNSQFNSIVTGANFRFHISAVKKDEIRNKISKQWIYNQECELNQFSFLPYCGTLSPYYSTVWYKIDGYKNYLPTDTPVEDICGQIGEDFEKYILPELCVVKSREDFLELRTQKLNRYKEKDVRLLLFYHAVQGCASELSGRAYDRVVELRKELELNAEDIASHLEWLDICRENSEFTKLDAKEIALRASRDEKR